MRTDTSRGRPKPAAAMPQHITTLTEYMHCPDNRLFRLEKLERIPEFTTIGGRDTTQWAEWQRVEQGKCRQMQKQEK
jgi:hypothetical protein